MAHAFHFKKTNDDIGILLFDLPGQKVNKFSTDVMQELEKQLTELAKENLKALIIASGKENIFIAGADINEIKDITDAEKGYEVGRRGQQIFQQLADLPYPTIALIHGASMGGGTEMSLACTYRLASDADKTKIALPEVNLGILPGWGGTQRLPRLIGIQKALDVILTGRKLDAKRALRYGLVDKIVAAEWRLDRALTFAREIVLGKGENYLKKRRQNSLQSFMLEKTPFGRAIMFSQAEKMVMKKSGGHYPAPLKALEVIKKTHGMRLEKGLEIEARALGELIVTPISKNLVKIFFWTEEIKKENGTKNKELKPREVSHSGILGAGTMGGGIAQLFAAKGIDVRVKDINYEAVSQAYKQADKVLKGLVKKRRISKDEHRRVLHRISGTTDYSGFKKAGLVVEAIVEDLEIKKKVLAELEKHVSEDTVIATNTSSLRVDDMAAALKNKGRFVGMHFFNPVHRMPLVEVVRGKQSDDEAIAAVFNLCQRTGKTPIVVNDGPGFLVNRLLVPYMVEAISMLQEGHSVQKLDGALRSFGMPMGPIELFDEVGIDVAHKVAKILQKFMGDRMADSDLLEKLVSDKRLGKKNEIGFYRYDDGKREYDKKIEEYISVNQKTKLTDQEIVRRMIYPMINEAARCLEEKIALRPRDVDIGMIFGTGFAPFRGGLLTYADSEGLGQVIDQLKVFEKSFGERFKPAAHLLKVHEKDKNFYKN